VGSTPTFENMKKLFVALLLIISIKSFAQSQNDFNYAVGIKLLAIEEFPKLLNEVREKTAYQNTSLNGLMLKINDNQISYRFQAYNSKIDNYTFTNECATCEEVAGVYKSFDFKILGFPFYSDIIGNKYIEDDTLIRKIINVGLLSPAQYFKLEKEIDANLQGMYLKAKKSRQPFRKVIDDYLDSQDITKEEKEEILNIWRNRLPALNLPKF
jgi:hypothetical protein